MLSLILLQLIDLLGEHLLLASVLLGLSPQPLHQLEVLLSTSKFLETVNRLVLELMAYFIVRVFRALILGFDDPCTYRSCCCWCLLREEVRLQRAELTLDLLDVFELLCHDFLNDLLVVGGVGVDALACQGHHYGLHVGPRAFSEVLELLEVPGERFALLIPEIQGLLLLLLRGCRHRLLALLLLHEPLKHHFLIVRGCGSCLLLEAIGLQLLPLALDARSLGGDFEQISVWDGALAPLELALVRDILEMFCDLGLVDGLAPLLLLSH